MTTLIKIIIVSILSLLFFSCNFGLAFNPGETGNGNVVTSQRPITQAFSSIKATEGLNVILSQSHEASITVEADENLQDLILTEISNGVLNIHTKSMIGAATSKKVYVSFPEVSSIYSSSGSEVRATNTITLDSLLLNSSSGAHMDLDINALVLTCKSSSGSDMRLSGKTTKLIATASSGSGIKAADLMAESGDVKATSGANITVNTSKKLISEASSGADIKYYGNPELVEINDSPSSKIEKK